MEDEFYNLTVKRNDLKTYIRRFQELAVLCPTMVPNSEKLMEVFIGGLPRSIEGNVTASKPQTLEEAITITQRLMDQVTKHNSVQGTNDHKGTFDDRRTFTNNKNYQNNRNNNNNRNNDHQQQHNRRTLHCQVSDLQQSGSFDQELQKQRASHWKQPATSVSNLSCLWREVELEKPVPKGKQQCLWKNILAEGQESSPRPKRRADKSFVSIYFASMLNIPPITLDTTYDIEMADENLVGFLTNPNSGSVLKTSSSRAMDPIMGSITFDGIHVYTAVALLCVQQIHVCVLGHGTMKRAAYYGNKIRFGVDDKEVYDHGLKTQSSCTASIHLVLPRYILGTAGYSLSTAQISNRSVTEKVSLTEWEEGVTV
ncbi:hypothetical protein Tco_1336630 [Tanacetum coccineum]